MQKSAQYEILIANLVSAIGRLHGLRNSVVEHNVHLKGVSGAIHQIDVLWKFEIEPFQFSAVIQAKGGFKSIDLPTVMTFKGVLDDLVGRPSGVMVTRSGFNKGNIFKVANSYGIQLFLLDEIPGIELKVIEEEYEVTITSARFSQRYDEAMLSKALSRLVFDDLKLVGTSSQRIYKADELKDMIAISLASSDFKGDSLCNAEFRLAEPLLMPVDSKHFLTIKAVFADVKKRHLSQSSAKKLSQYLLQSATGDKRYRIDGNFSVIVDK